MQVLKVQYKTHLVGALSYDLDQQIGFFEYDPAFIKTGLQLSPIQMPLSSKIYSFANLEPDAFKGLPGLLADSLPDDFGNAVLDNTIEAVSQWQHMATENNVPHTLITEISKNLRLYL